MKILAVCNYGENRSRFLAGYLKEKGYETDFTGVKNPDVKEVQSKIDAADVVIPLEHAVRVRLEKDFDISKKPVVELNVIFQADDEKMHAEIAKQIDRHLPLKTL